MDLIQNYRYVDIYLKLSEKQQDPIYKSYDRQNIFHKCDLENL